MSAIATALASLAANHIFGHVLGGIAGRQELFGFGLKTLSGVSKRAIARRHERARREHQEWLEAATQLPAEPEAT